MYDVVKCLGAIYVMCGILWNILWVLILRDIIICQDILLHVCYDQYQNQH